jgi:thiol-disulfide isomerase/thioredoxin
MKRLLLPLMILVFAAIGGTAGFLLGGHVYDNPPPPPGVEQYDIGDTLPADTALVDAAGGTRTLGEWRGRLLVVNYWASWCPPCIEEMPLLDRFAEVNADRIAVIGIAEDDPDAVTAFLQRTPVDYPILQGGIGTGGLPSMRVGNSRNVLPYTVLVGPDGTLLERRAGLVDEALLERWLDAHGAAGG